MTCDEAKLTDEERELVDDARKDDISFLWVLIHLGIMGNPPPFPSWRPSAMEVEKAITTLDKLATYGCIVVGRLDATGEVAPPGIPVVRHVKEPLQVVHDRVIASLDVPDPFEWKTACWVIAA